MEAPPRFPPGSLDAELSAVRSALAAAEQRYRDLADWLPIFVMTRDPHGRLLWMNAAWYRYTGQDPNVLTNATWSDAIHPDDLVRARRERGDAIPDGRAIKSELRVRRADGTYRWFLNRSVPVRSTEGRVTSWLGTMTDIEEHKRAEETLRVLSESAALFGDLLDVDVDDTLRALAALLVVHLADSCAIDVLGPDETLRNVAVAARFSHERRLLRECVLGAPRRADSIFAEVARTGETLRTPLATPKEVAATMQDPATQELTLRLGRRAFLVVPIVVAGRAFGTIALGNSQTVRAFSDDDERVVRTIARRAGIAIANARAYHRQREVAHTLQAAFLPPALPAAPDLAFDAVYVPASDEFAVGGDWYDVYRRDPFTYGISLGDIEGHGLAAAVPMGKMRQTLNTLAFADIDPVSALAIADGALEREHGETFATAFAARFDCRGARFEYASAGHPAPFVRGADGTLRRLASADVPVGLGGMRPRTSHLERLARGELVVAFTDGLLELDRDVDRGESALAAALGHPAFAICSSPAQLARALLVAESPRDDVVILTMRVRAERVWTFDVHDADGACSVRDAFVAVLEGDGAPESVRFAAEVVLGEIRANAVRHAPGPIDVGLRREGSTFVVTALDRGPGFVWAPSRPDDDSESGRGLFLIEAFASRVRLEHVPGFGSYLDIAL